MFIAIDLPPAIATEVRAICQGLPAAHWGNLAQLHLTLRFLGDTPDDRVAGLRAALASVTGPPFTLALRGVGVFPHKRRPARVLWAGVTPDEPACQLKATIDGALGPDPEAAERGFSPHLTLARFREDPGPALARYLAERAPFASAPWTVDSFRLYKSTIGHDGAVHELVEAYPLGHMS
jgi:2'-5' RNA ligase